MIKRIIKIILFISLMFPLAIITVIQAFLILSFGVSRYIISGEHLDLPQPFIATVYEKIYNL